MDQRARNAAPGGEMKPSNEAAPRGAGTITPNDAQPAAAPRYFEPLPLGSNAFAPPMYSARDEDEKSRVRQLLPLIVVCVAGTLGAIGVGVALLMTRPPSPDSAEPAKHEEPAEAVAAKPPVEPVHEAPLPKRTTMMANAPAATGATQAAPQAVPSAAPAPIAAPQPVAAPSVSKTASIESSTDKDKAKDSSKPRNKAAAKLGPTPTRDEVLSSMAKIMPAARRCFAGTHGQVVASLVISNSGRVSAANVTGMLGPVGSCVALAVRKAQFPKFTNPSVSIRYPMQF